MRCYKNPETLSSPRTTPPENPKSNITEDLNKLSEEKLSTITNRDFLRIGKENRLQYLTDPSVKSSEIDE